LRAAGFEERDLQAGFCETFAGPAPGGAGTDDEDIVRMLFLFSHRF
jgi:hypothetical protein